MIGKKIRLSKIMNPATNRTVIVPMDHGITLGPVNGLVKPMDTIGAIARGGADAIVLNKGMFMQVWEYPELMKSCNFILHVSASTSLSKDIGKKRIVSTVEQAVKMGAVGVSAHINLGADTEDEMLSDLGKISDACLEWGMPLLAMMYVREIEGASLEGRNIAHAAKIAEELGADIVKVNAPTVTADIKYAAECVNIPVVIAGGVKTGTEDMITLVAEALEAGVSGVSIGRNVFQSENPGSMANLIYNLVHGRLSCRETMAKISAGTGTMKNVI